jgi:hypothetical protein
MPSDTAEQIVGLYNYCFQACYKSMKYIAES